MALGMAESDAPPLGPDWNGSTAGWNAFKFGWDVHGPHLMNPTDFDDPLTFFSSSTTRLRFVFLGEMSQQL